MNDSQAILYLEIVLNGVRELQVVGLALRVISATLVLSLLFSTIKWLIERGD